MKLLCYEWRRPSPDSLSGPGWYWDDASEIYNSDEDLKKRLLSMKEEASQHLKHWVQKYQGYQKYQRYRGEFYPLYRKMVIYDLTECGDPEILSLL